MRAGEGGAAEGCGVNADRLDPCFGWEKKKRRVVRLSSLVTDGRRGFARPHRPEDGRAGRSTAEGLGTCGEVAAAAWGHIRLIFREFGVIFQRDTVGCVRLLPIS